MANGIKDKVAILGMGCAKFGERYNSDAEDLMVDHVAVRGNIAALTLGSKGIALYDISDPTMPEEKGIFPIGYSYKSQFWGEKLLVCSREGLQILTVEY